MENEETNRKKHLYNTIPNYDFYNRLNVGIPIGGIIMIDLMIDAGHGGKDSGALGDSVKEKDWTLKMSLYQYERLKELGVKVGITRTGDQTLDPNPRTALVKNKARYCMSNHFNAFNGEARGVETIHSKYSDGKTAKALGLLISETSGLPFRRAFKRTQSNGDDFYYMHRMTGNTETIIVEYGFIDNPIDRNYYKNDGNFFKVAEAVVKFWCGIFKVNYKSTKDVYNEKTINKKLWRVQVGAFENVEGAKRLSEELRKKNIDTYILRY